MRVGIIGTGFVAEFHLRALQSVRGIEVVAVYSTDPGRGEEFALKVQQMGLGQCISYGSIRELCHSIADVVAVFNQNDLRVDTFQQIAAAVESGAKLKGIVCEKPLGRTIAEGMAIVELATKMGVLTSYFENQIHMSAINNCLQQLQAAADKSGNLTLVRSAEEHGGPHRPWFWDPVRQGGGVLSDMGCHSIAACRHMLTPKGEAPNFLEPVEIYADLGLLKWGREPYLNQLQAERGVDYSRTPAEDFATGIITWRNPKTGQLVKALFTDSWMFDKVGLRLFMEGMGPGYAMSVDSLISSAGIFISDAVAEAIGNAEDALEKSQSTRGLLLVQPNEPDLYGYVAEWRDALERFESGRNGYLNLAYGLETLRLVSACYLSHELRRQVTLADVPDDYRCLIGQGRGAEVLFRK